MTKILFFDQAHTLNSKSSPLIVGFFDGLHRGHAMLFKRVHENNFNLLTFINVPHKLNDLLYSDQERLADLQELKPQNIFLLDLQQNNMQCMSFIYKLLKQIKPSEIIVGSDFKFGKQRLGNIQQLKKYFKVRVIKLNYKYKTSLIKKMIIDGNVHQANKLLINPYTITGVVVHGKKMGRKLNYPTANVHLPKQTVVPKVGSYVGYTYVDHIRYPSAIFVKDHLLETHMFNFKKSIYGKIISIELQKFHKPFEQSKNFADLKTIIDQKVKTIRKYFTS
ncbi:MAG: hypothetical protein LBP70_03025 [Mycoplasmataceae bacterium]|jgi:riboflavin kinase/FMN adenylyltransferase|nr:hypothetical protein [Mycoplasmataceae bacterium]